MSGAHEMCYFVIRSADPGKRIVIIKHGESGYFETDLDRGPIETAAQLEGYVDELNAQLGVTPQERDVMVARSMRRL